MRATLLNRDLAYLLVALEDACIYVDKKRRD